MTEWHEIFELSEQLGSRLQQSDATVTTAESCTGGGVAFALTAVAGSSAWFNHSVVTYSNDVKHRTLGVSEFSLSQYGAVSEEVASEMATGVAIKANADYSIAVSGIAGPDGGSELKPVGTVCFAWSLEGRVETETAVFDGDRHSVRMQSIEYALKGLLQRI
jgi:nicotinamide-nucleotide amidase